MFLLNGEFLTLWIPENKERKFMKQEAQGQPCQFFSKMSGGLDCVLSIIFFYAVLFKELLNVEVLKCCKTVKQFKVKINSGFPYLSDFLIFGFSIHAYHKISLIVS